MANIHESGSRTFSEVPREKQIELGKKRDELIADMGLVPGIAAYGEVLAAETGLKPALIFSVQERRVREAADLLPEDSTRRKELTIVALEYGRKKDAAEQAETDERNHRIYGDVPKTDTPEDPAPPRQQRGTLVGLTFRPAPDGGRPQTHKGRQVLMLRHRPAA